MRRREFLVRGLLMTSAAVSLISLLESCSATVRAPKTGKAACAAKGTAAEAFYHTHQVECVTVEALDERAGVTLTLTKGLTHEVSLSPAQLVILTRGGTVELESSRTLFHTHLVTFKRV